MTYPHDDINQKPTTIQEELTQRANYTRIPNELIRSDIDAGAFKVWCYFASQAESFNPSYRFMMDELKMGATRIRKAIDSLIDSKMIIKEPDPGRRTKYICTPTSSWLSYVRHKGVSKTEGGCVQNGGGTVSTVDTHRRLSRIPISNSTQGGQTDLSPIDQCLDILISGFKIAGIHLGRHQVAILQQAKIAIHTSGITPEDLRPKSVWISNKLSLVETSEMPRKLHSLIIGASKAPSGIETPDDSLTALRDKAKRLDASPKYGGGEASFIYGSTFMKWSDYDAKIDHLIKELGFDYLKKAIGVMRGREYKPGRISTIAEQEFDGDVAKYLAAALSTPKTSPIIESDRPKKNNSLSQEDRDRRADRLREFRLSLKK